MMVIEPITRAEQIMSGENLEPITREEMFLAKAAGMDVDTPKPITRREMFLSNISGSSGGSSSGDNFPIGDGNTHIWISLAEGRTSPCVQLQGDGSGTKRVTVDWGDGSEPDLLTLTSTVAKRTPNHEYGKAGDYIITLSGDVHYLSASNYECKVVTDTNNDIPLISAYASSGIKKIECGNNTRLTDGSFGKAYFLEDSVLPKGTVNIPSYLYQYCYGIENYVVQEGVETVGDRAFYGCIGLAKVTFASSVTAIGGYAFNTTGCVMFDFSKSTAVPSLSNQYAFDTIPSNCIFKIPASLYDEWIAATNWSAVAAKYTFVGV